MRNYESNQQDATTQVYLAQLYMFRAMFLHNIKSA
jgi:hypothetical protein